jgi:[acyl-carrier-protein] S-malonyltransferase
MVKTVFLFPGQGSQQVGMGRELYENFPEARAVFEEAGRALGYDLANLCFNGPAEKLTLTEHAQPAIMTTSMATAAVLQKSGVKPDYAAGHSLGEYSAVVYAGGLSLEQGVRTVRLRGELMSRAVPAGEGAMAAIIGLSVEQVSDICREVSGTVDVANMNSPSQVVISGSREAVEKAGRRAGVEGAKRVAVLEVSGPFHSRLMKPVEDRFRPHLENSGIKDLDIPVVANVDARPHRQAGEVINSLVSQITSPVRWTETLRYLSGEGVGMAVEVGPKKVLAGLMKRTAPEIKTMTTDGLVETVAAGDYLVDGVPG